MVTSANSPAAFTPRRLTSTTAQIAPSVSVSATALLFNEGATFINAPANANAIAGSEAQIEIQQPQATWKPAKSP